MNTIIRRNLLTRPGYTPYCGASCNSMPRTRFDGEQFRCGDCGWVSSFEPEFIARYKEHRPMTNNPEEQQTAPMSTERLDFLFSRLLVSATTHVVASELRTEVDRLRAEVERLQAVLDSYSSTMAGCDQ